MELFGDPVKSPKHSLSPIGTIGEVMTGTTPSMKKDEYYDSKDIMFIKPSKIEVNPIDAATPLNHIGSEAFFVYVLLLILYFLRFKNQKWF